MRRAGVLLAADVWRAARLCLWPSRLAACTRAAQGGANVCGKPASLPPPLLQLEEPELPPLPEEPEVLRSAEVDDLPG